MELKTEIVNGRKKITIISRASGVDKTREAVLAAMGPGFTYKEEKVHNEKSKKIN